MKKWVLKNKNANFTKMAEYFNITENLARVLVNRDINTPRKARNFLTPTLNTLHDFKLVEDIEKATDILNKAIECKKNILIYGDYDVDGVTSTTILYKSLKILTQNISYYIPHREHEGYGLNIDTLQKIHANIDLIITTDNGIASLDEVNFLKEKNIEVIIIDHHEPILDENGEMLLPCADAIIDPKRLDCKYPFKLMCAGGLAYRFIKYFFEKFSYNLVNENELIVFAMIATICDIVDLYEDNRVIVKRGLEIINKSKMINKGLYNLFLKNNIDRKIINHYDIGFIIGPCINAVGRLDIATTAVELFVSVDNVIIDKLSSELVELNIERKRITKESFDRVLDKVKLNEVYKDDVIVIYDELTHESVAGIVAGRIKDYFYKPTIVLTKSHNDAKGSARSISTCDIYKLLSQSRELFLRFGGHSMAAGLSLEKSNIEKLREELNKNSKLKEEDFIEVIEIENTLEISEITIDQYEMLEALKPYGKGNREPLFTTNNAIVSSIRIIDSKNTIIFTFKDNYSFKSIKGIFFGDVNYFFDILKNDYDDYQLNNIYKGNLNNINLVLDIVYSIQLNEYNNNISIQTLIKDMKISK